MPRIRRISLAAFMVSCCLGAWSAEGGEILKGKGLSAFAPFEWTDDTGCQHTSVWLNGGESVTQDPPGPPTTSSMAWIQVNRYDSCIGDFFGGFAFLDQGLQLTGDLGLNRATLRGTARVCQSYPVEICLDFQINVAWVATGTTQHNTYMSSVHVGSTSTRLRQIGEFRGASATGSVSADGENWTPVPTIEGWAWISYNQNLELLVNQ
jgi:hypothetical protein